MEVGEEASQCRKSCERAVAEVQRAQVLAVRLGGEGREASRGNTGNVRKSKGFKLGERKEITIVECVGGEAAQVEVFERGEAGEGALKEMALSQRSTRETVDG